jgi:sigma-B regulation protein RsbU (phosphoserine phosphatase)
MTTLSRAVPTTLKILLVENDSTEFSRLHAILQEAGHEVVDAGGMAQALSALTEHKPHVILIDMELPHMNGLTLARRLKQLPLAADVPVIALTAYPNLFAQGAAMEFEFAACLAKPLDPQTLSQQVVSVAAGSWEKHPAITILVADDLATNRQLLCSMLEPGGYTVIEVRDGQAALATLQTTATPIVALIDWQMPGMEGTEVCRQARRRVDAPPMFLILVTARDNQRDIVTGLQTGANDYVTKPFVVAELLARVKIGTQMVELQQSLINRVTDLQNALAQVKRLSGILPICSYCKKIRDDYDYWQQVEEYITRHSEAHFSHGICPECYSVHVKPELARLRIASTLSVGGNEHGQNGGPGSSVLGTSREARESVAGIEPRASA